MPLEPAPLTAPEPRAFSPIKGRHLLLVVTLILAAVCGFSLILFPGELVVAALLAGLLATVMVTRPFVGLLVFMGVMVVQPGELMYSLASLHLERIVAGLAVVGLFLELRSQDRALVWKGHPMLTALYVVLAGFLCSQITSVWIGNSLSTLGGFLRTLCICLLILNLVRSVGRLNALVRLFMVLHLYLVVITLKGYYSGEIMFAQGIERAVGLTSFGGDPNALASTLVSIIPFYVLGLRTERAWGWRVLWVVASIGAIWTIVLTGSRAGFLGLLFLSILLWFMSPHKVANLLAALLLLCALWAIMPEQYKTRYLTIKNKELDESSQGRIDAWKSGFQMFMERPAFGVGVGNFSAAHAMQATEGKRKHWLQAHSLYVQIGAETGLTGFMCFFFFLFRLLTWAARLIRRLPIVARSVDYRSVVARACFMATLGQMLTGIFGHSLLRITWYLLAAYVVVVARLPSPEANAAQSPDPVRDPGSPLAGSLEKA